MDKYTDEQNIIECLECGDVEYVFKDLEDYKYKYGENDFYYLALSDYYIFFDRYDDVVELLNQAIENGYESNEIFERMADAYFGIEQFDRCLDYIEMCDFTVYDSDFLHLFVLGGICNYRLGRYEEAIHYFEDILMEDDSNMLGYFFAGLCYLHMGDEKTGIQYLTIVANSQREELIYSLFGELSQMNDISLIEMFKNRVDEAYQYHAYYALACTYKNNKDYTKAIQYFKKFLRYEDNIGVSVQLAKLYNQVNEQSRCQDILHDIYDNLPPLEEDEFYLDSIGSLLEMMAYIDLTNDEKESKITEWLFEFPFDETVIETILAFCIEYKMYYLAKKIIITHDSLFYMNTHLQYLRVVYYMDIGNHKRALGYLLLMENQEDMPIYQKYVVVNMFFLGIYDKTIKMGKHLLPDGRIAMILFGALKELKREQEAMELLEYMKEHDDEDYEDKEIYIKFLEDMGIVHE